MHDRVFRDDLPFAVTTSLKNAIQSSLDAMCHFECDPVEISAMGGMLVEVSKAHARASKVHTQHDLEMKKTTAMFAGKGQQKTGDDEKGKRAA